MLACALGEILPIRLAQAQKLFERPLTTVRAFALRLPAHQFKFKAGVVFAVVTVPFEHKVRISLMKRRVFRPESVRIHGPLKVTPSD